MPTVEEWRDGLPILPGSAGDRGRDEIRGTRLAAPAHLDAEGLSALALARTTAGRHCDNPLIARGSGGLPRASIMML